MDIWTDSLCLAITNRVALNMHELVALCGRMQSLLFICLGLVQLSCGYQLWTKRVGDIFFHKKNTQSSEDLKSGASVPLLPRGGCGLCFPQWQGTHLFLGLPVP